MERHDIIEAVGKEYITSNIEAGEYSYAKEAGSIDTLEEKVGHKVSHFKLDIRFELENTVVLVETKQNFVPKDEDQLKEYVEEEKALHPGKKIIAILANTNDDKIKVWKSFVDNEHFLKNETVWEKMNHYRKIFYTVTVNDRETVMKNTYDLNILLHKMDIDEAKRSQFVGSCLLYIKFCLSLLGIGIINSETEKKLCEKWGGMIDGDAIRNEIKSTLKNLLDGVDNQSNKEKKIQLLQKNVLEDQKIRKLTKENLIEILRYIFAKIFIYINSDSSEGQDILNLFFIAFNKYTGKADKNQAFTPDHITDFMAKLTEIDRSTVVLDPCCGSGSFLVQAMVKELADCRRNRREEEAKEYMDIVKKKRIFGIEIEEKAFGLATTNMLIHSDGNSNIILENCFSENGEKFIREADPDVILMNPPYNAKPIGIPEKYKKNWGTTAGGKEDPTKGMVFIKYLSDIVKEMNKEKESRGEKGKTVKLAVLLPVSAAIGNNNILKIIKTDMLENNTLEAVFTLPNEVFYPGASVSACCMLWTLGKSHDLDRETFFGYYKEDGFRKKKNLGRVEQFYTNDEGKNISKWKEIENEWLKLFRNKKEIEGLSATACVSGDDEWLCEAYMKTDYSTLCEADFQKTVNDYLAFMVKTGKEYES